MILKMDNVGVLKDVNVSISGLSVITGKNSAGKTTVGKVLYSVMRANYNIEESFEQAKIEYLVSMIHKLSMCFYRFNLFAGFSMEIIKNDNNDFYLNYLKLFDSKFLNNLLGSGVKPTLDYILKLKEELQDIDFYAYSTNFTTNKRSDDFEKKRTKPDYFSSIKEEMIELCDKMLDSIQDENAFQNFIKDRTRAFMNYEFHNQIGPVRNRQSVSTVNICDNGSSVISFIVNSDEDYEFGIDSTFAFTGTKAIFIDNPFVIDQVFNQNNQTMFNNRNVIDDIDSLGTFGITSHDEYLIDLLRKRVTDNFFSNRELQLSQKSVITKINSIIPGEFQESGDGFFYIDKDAKLDVQNLATGSKMFSIIKLLMINGHLNKKTILVLDEPEAHLHPEWINKFAEIMVLLIKEIGIRILLTTHSPNLLIALEVYSKKYQIEDESHFYLSQIEENGWHANILCIDDNINEGYAHLSIPLIEMSINREEK